MMGRQARGSTPIRFRHFCFAITWAHPQEASFSLAGCTGPTRVSSDLTSLEAGAGVSFWYCRPVGI